MSRHQMFYIFIYFYVYGSVSIYAYHVLAETHENQKRVLDHLERICRWLRAGTWVLRIVQGSSPRVGNALNY